MLKTINLILGGLPLSRLRKKNFLIIFLFVVFALPIPIALLGCFVSFMWLLSSIVKDFNFIEIVAALFGTLVGLTYPLTYIFSLKNTQKEQKVSFKTLLPIVHLLTAFLFLLSLTPTSNYIDRSTNHFGFAKKDFSVVEENDTHGGFLGDGSYYLILDCSGNKALALEKIKDWKKLPLSENLNLIMYGGEKDGIDYGYNLSEEAKIPKIKNGYYMFKDRHSESQNAEDDSELLSRHSFNFSIAVYNCDTDKLYYFEFDT